MMIVIQWNDVDECPITQMEEDEHVYIYDGSFVRDAYYYGGHLYVDIDGLEKFKGIVTHWAPILWPYHPHRIPQDKNIVGWPSNLFSPTYMERRLVQ